MYFKRVLFMCVHAVPPERYLPNSLTSAPRGYARRLARPPARITLPKDQINLALKDLRYTANVDASGDDLVTVTSSDGHLDGVASSTRSMVWPTGIATRPPVLSFPPPVTEVSEDDSILLGPVDVRFGDGSMVVQGTVQCSAGMLELGHQATDGDGGGIFILEGRHAGEGGRYDATGAGDLIVLRGLPKDMATALSTTTYKPPKDWNSMVYGVVNLDVEIQAVDNVEVR